MKKLLLILVLSLMIFSCENKNEIPNSIKFNTSSGLPIIKAKLNGKNANFLLDTGASMSVVDSSMVSRYNFKIHRSTDMTVSGLGGTKKLYHVSNARLYYNGQPMYVRFKSTNMRNIRLNVKVIGVLGSDYLIQNKLIIDYKNKVLRKSNMLD